MFRAFVVVMFSMACAAQAAPVTIASARVWPAADYTRITLESTKPVSHAMTILKAPDRVVLDLENIELGAALKTLSAKILSSDPYIKQVRVANFKPGVVRLVIDLKSEVRPSLFAVLPVGEYKHRLVLDIYPLHDPLLALLDKPAENSMEKAAAKPIVKAPEKPIEKSTEKPAERPLDKPSETAVQPGGWSPDKAGAASKDEAAIGTPVATTEEKSVATEKLKDKTVKDKPRDKSAEAEKPADKDQSDSDEADKEKHSVARLITIAIDPGHGGEDPGAHGQNGTHEKDVTLAIARKLKELVSAEPNMRAVLTRDGDYFIPLHGRVVKARKLQADLFVSIHADAYVRPDARGSSVFALSERGATSAMARYLAQNENASDLIGGVSLDDKDPYLAKTLLDLSQTATINDSLKLGKAVLGNLGDINTLHKGMVEQAGFAVLKSPDIPSILVETAFISNPEEEAKLTDEDYQAKIAKAILGGIKRYFASNPPLAKSKLAANE